VVDVLVADNTLEKIELKKAHARSPTGAVQQEEAWSEAQDAWCVKCLLPSSDSDIRRQIQGKL
jgi:hypothetical protein